MILTKSGKTGRKSQILTDIMLDADSALSLKLSKIETEEKIYSFNYPVLFQIYQEGSGTIIENELLDIYAAGKTVAEAKNDLFNQLEHSYLRLNELKDYQLSPRLLATKQYFNFIVKSIDHK